MALLQQIEISKQDRPSKHDLSLLRSWLDLGEGNDCSLRGPGSDVWAGDGRTRETETDFLVLSSKHRNRDRFERWTGDTLLGIYHHLISRCSKVSRPSCIRCNVLTP